VAHSITLALATFNLVVLPSRFTESMIALSILYVAVENLVRRRNIDRWKITFLFGLVHGFGFSNVLREMQLPRADLALSLFSFNLGRRDRATGFRGAAVPRDRRSDPLRLDQAAPRGIHRDRTAGGVLVHPAGVLWMKS